ncbi:SusC/RagA family TonB-linked outer membrane protein [Chitinophaga filiformis]|uniref:SusC/RagA family TonB-linked outer membrane protein n=1 Tax=Chitinophaga filiformis TaxID=104663 RepID=A0ABY4HYJ1_CHIFI|nr:SusC/RagA family TonB-linked outer membrane protein [Chitinophaga filiformis]UPK68003.1 SusC/RagA family TonB-linked outer membrane protein [Chitinophaga filiformis]
MPSAVHSGNRLFYKLLFIIICVQCYSFAEAQGNARISEKLVTLSVKGSPLNVILKRISKNTGITIYFNNLHVAPFTNVSINVKNKPFKEVMHDLLDPLGLDWVEVNESTITVRKAPAPIQSTNTSTSDTTISVSGKVMNEKGSPIVSATVALSGTNRGTTTGPDGSFILNGVPKSASITISSVSFLTQQVSVKGRSNLGAIPMKEYVSDLDETVVKGYYNTTKRFNTGTVYSIKGEELAKQPVTNPIMALQGRVPNLIINPSSGLPNAAIKFQMRGQNSLSSFSLRSEPLIIIDGIPYPNTIQAGAFGSLTINNDQISALSLINVNEIEQIDVLSDADATSIYGSRGGNGVILITTKKGKTGEMAITLSLSTGMSQVSNKLELLNTEQYLQLRRQAYKNDDLAIPDRSSPVKTFNNYDLTVWDPNRNTDWQKEFLGGTASTYTANLSVQGGSPTIQYLLSGNYNTQKYIYPGKNKYEIGTTNLSITGNSLNGKFRAQLNSSYTFNNVLSPGSDFTKFAVTLAPNAPSLYDSEGKLNWEPDTTASVRVSTWVNPYAQLLRTSELTNSNFRESAELSYKISENLSVKSTVGFAEVRAKTLSIYPIASMDPFISTNTGFAFRSDTKSQSFTVDPQITYSKIFNLVKLEALLGASYQSLNQEFEYISGEGYTSDALLRSIPAARIITGDNTNSQYKYVAGFGRLNFNVSDKYLFNATARRDGSSRFGPDYQFGNFWSLGAGYIFSQEDYFKHILPSLSFGKLRASYGTSGNDGISDYQYIELYEPQNGYSYQNTTPLRSLGAINPDYHWETIKKLELGIEIGVFNNRLFLNASYWRTRASDQLGLFPLPATAGADAIVKNQNARIQNMGWDFVLNAKVLNSKRITWTLSANLGTQNNKLLARPEGLYNGYGFNRFVKVGEPFTGFAVAYRSKGVNAANGLYQFETADKNVSTDLNNFYAEALKIKTIPLTMGINNSFTFKGFNISFFLQLTKQMGRNVLFDPAFTFYNPGSFTSQNPSEYGNLPVEYMNNWQKPGDNAVFQRLTSGNFSNPSKNTLGRAVASDLAWVDASFIRLRNVSLSYAVPASWIKRWHLNTFSLFLQAQNVFTITKYKGLDPEVQSATSLPLLRTFNGGIQIGI